MKLAQFPISYGGLRPLVNRVFGLTDISSFANDRAGAGAVFVYFINTAGCGMRLLCVGMEASIWKPVEQG